MLSGTVSLVDAEKRLLSNALLDFSNERFVLLSESCIPVYNFPTVYQYLTRSIHIFVQSYDDPSCYGRGRYNRRMKPDISLGDWRKGSQWFELNRYLAAIIVAETKYYTIFKKYCRPACYPDEHYLPTFLHMFYGAMNANQTATYVDWSVIAPHPGTFTAVIGAFTEPEFKSDEILKVFDFCREKRLGSIFPRFCSPL